MSKAPYETVTEAYELPFPANALHEKQATIVNDLAPLERGGYYTKVGTGKTSMSAVDCLYQQITGLAECHIIIVPPILITQWVKWLSKIHPPRKIVAYKGTIKQRKVLRGDIPGANLVVMGLGIFKNDFNALLALYDGVNVGGIVDEATQIKNVGTGNFRRVRQFFDGRTLKLLTGTPCATPADSYAYMKLIAPDIYRTQQVFDSVHVAKRDFFDRIVGWGNLDLLKTNMEINTRRLDKREIFPGLPLPIFDPIEYELEEEHYALYKELCEQQVLELENGGKIDATTVAKLWTCTQQIILNWDHFSGDPSKKGAGFDLVDQILEELAPEGKKLIIVANYRMTMAGLMRHFKTKNIGAALINSTVTPAQQEREKDRFVEDPDCRVLNLHPLSGGKGLDGLQHVCSEMLFLEEPLSPIDFEQPVGRIDRPGQTIAPHVRLAVAQNTIQVRLHNLHLKKDDLATYINGAGQSLRAALYGG